MLIYSSASRTPLLSSSSITSLNAATIVPSAALPAFEAQTTVQRGSRLKAIAVRRSGNLTNAHPSPCVVFREEIDKLTAMHMAPHYVEEAVLLG